MVKRKTEKAGGVEASGAVPPQAKDEKTAAAKYEPTPLQAKAQASLTELRRLYLGVEHVPRIFTAAVFSRSRILLLGGHGKGKSYIAELAGKILAASYSRVQGSQGLTENRFIATLDVPALMQGQKKIVWAPFVSARIKVFDEFNRGHPTTLNSLFELMAEGFIDFSGERHDPGPYAFVATMNPGDGSSTYEVPAPLLDRFDLALSVQSVDVTSKMRLLGDRLNGSVPQPNPILQPGELEAIWQEVSHVTVPPAVVEKLARVERTLQVCEHGDKEFLTGFPGVCENCRFKEAACAVMEPAMPVSERLGLSAIRVAKGLAYLDGRGAVEWRDVEEVLPFAAAHRVALTHQFTSKHITKLGAVVELLKKVEKVEGERVEALKFIVACRSGQVDVLQAQKDAKTWSENDLVLSELLQGVMKDFTRQVERFKRSLREMKVEALEDLLRGSSLADSQRKVVQERLTERLTVRVTIADLREKWSTVQGAAITVGKDFAKQMREAKELTGINSDEVNIHAADGVMAGLGKFFDCKPKDSTTHKRLLELLKAAGVPIVAEKKGMGGEGADGEGAAAGPAQSEAQK
jgi:MoxR-like ATPase